MQTMRPWHLAVLAFVLSPEAEAQSLPPAAERDAVPWRERPLFVLRGVEPTPFPGFGYAVAGGGDVDGDGVPDLVVGAPYEFEHGRARVFSGSTGALLLPPLEHPAGWLGGFSVALIGDLDGDGRSEILVGDPMLGGVGPGGTGQAIVFAGADGSRLKRLVGDETSDEFGYRVAATGDVDGDGVPDFAVAALADHDFSDGPGYVRLFSGASWQTIRTYSRPGVRIRYGLGLASAGDVNGDGRPDLLIGAPRSGSGVVEMRSGADGALLWQSSGASSSLTDYGVAVAPAGDVDGDGAADVVIGVTGSSLARVLRASDGAFVADFTGPADDFFAGAVLGIGDVNSDGHADLAIGAKWADSPTETFTGATWIRSGADGSTLATYYGRFSGDRVGFELASLGDVDGDGVHDFAIGASQDGNAGPGFVAVYSGARH